MCSVFALRYSLSSEHNACTLHRKERKPKSSASSVWQRIIQWHNQSTLFTYDYNWTTEVWRPTSEPTLTRYIRCHGVGQKKRINMKSDHLHLNSDKTQFIRVGSRQQLASVSVTKIVPRIQHQDIAHRHVSWRQDRCRVDILRWFSTHVKQIAACCFYQLRQLWSIRPALTSDNAIMLIHALIASRIPVTVFYSRPLPYTSALYSRWWMPQRAWL